MAKRFSEKDNGNGTAYRVKVLDAGSEIHDKIIRIGLQNRRFAEVREGLSAGERIKLNAPPKKNNNNQYGYPRTPRL